MSEQQGRWYWSGDEERWNEEGGPFDTRDEALEAGRERLLNEDGQESRCWTGQRRDWAPSLHASDILEELGQRAYDEVGDVAEDWPELDEAKTAELQKALDELVEKFVPTPRFWQIVDTECHEAKVVADVE